MKKKKKKKKKKIKHYFNKTIKLDKKLLVFCIIKYINLLFIYTCM